MEKNRGNTGAGGSCLNEGGVRCWGKQSSKDGLVITKQVQKILLEKKILLETHLFVSQLSNMYVLEFEWRYSAGIDNAVPRNGSINENLKVRYEIFMMREIDMNRLGHLLLAYQSPIGRHNLEFLVPEGTIQDAGAGQGISVLT